MLHELPPELVIHILSFLPFQSIGALQQASRPWNDFIRTSEPLVYYNAAVVHNFINRPAESLTSLNKVLKRHEGRLFRGAKAWKEFCECRSFFRVVIDNKWKSTTIRQTSISAGEQLGWTGTVGIPEYFSWAR